MWLLKYNMQHTKITVDIILIQFVTCTWWHGVTSEECINRERHWEGILVMCIFHKLHPKAGFWHQVSICALYKASVAMYMNLCLTVSMAGCLCLFPGSSKWNGWRPRNTSAVTKLCKYTSTYLQLVDEKKIKDQENMHVIFDLQDFEAGYLNRAWSNLVNWVNNHFLESCATTLY